MAISDLLTKAGISTPDIKSTSPVEPPKTGIASLLEKASTPVQSKQNPVDQAVEQTYPVAQPEKQAPESLFSKYMDWSDKTGQKIADVGSSIFGNFSDVFKQLPQASKDVTATVNKYVTPLNKTFKDAWTLPSSVPGSKEINNVLYQLTPTKVASQIVKGASGGAYGGLPDDATNPVSKLINSVSDAVGMVATIGGLSSLGASC